MTPGPDFYAPDPLPSFIHKGLQRKRHQYSIEYKLNAIAKWRELHENTSQAARHPDVNVDRQTLKGWILNENSYRSMSNKKVAKRLKKRTKRNIAVNYRDIEKDQVPFEFIRPDLPEPSHPGPSNQGYPDKKETTKIKDVSATMSSEDSLSQHGSLSQSTAANFNMKTGSQFKKQYFEKREKKPMTHSVLLTPSQMQVPQHLQAVAPPLARAQPAPKQVLAAPVQVVKQKPVERPRPKEKRIFVVADHQRCVMSNLTSLWKSGKLCDAGIGNGSSTVMVHKLVLSAVCPKLLSVFNMDMMSHEFLQVNFPRAVSSDALNAFAEYMYNGILDLDPDILTQLKVIAKRLDMKDFEQLCDSHLPNNIHQPASASFTNVPSFQTTMQNPGTTPFGFDISTSMLSDPEVIDIKEEITEAELVQIKKEPATIFSQESAVPTNRFGDSDGLVINPNIKTEPVAPEGPKYTHRICSSSSNNQALSSSTTTAAPSSSSTTAATTASSSISLVPVSSTEFTIPLSESADFKSTRLKTSYPYAAPLISDLSHVSNIVETMHSQSNSSKPSSQPLDSLSSVNLPKSYNDVYPIRLFTVRGDNLPLLTKDSPDVMTVD